MGAGRPKSNRTCDVQDCDNRHYGKGLCSLHYHRQYHGKPLEGTTHGNSKPLVGYRQAHYRVERARGKARMYFCADCDVQAQEWSLVDSPEVVAHISNAANSRGKAYSLNIADYEPLCIPCHRKRDGNLPPVPGVTV